MGADDKRNYPDSKKNRGFIIATAEPQAYPMVHRTFRG